MNMPIEPITRNDYAIVANLQELDFFQLLEKRGQTESFDQELMHYNGLLSYEAMEVLFIQHDSMSILKCLWTETNQEARLRWLRDHIQMRHALLYFELAIEELIAKPTIETFLQVSLYYFQLGVFRLEQDLRCFDEIPVGLKEDLLAIYNSHLDRIARKLIKAPYLNHLQKQEDLRKQDGMHSEKYIVLKYVDKYIEEVEKTRKLDSILPHPRWLEKLGNRYQLMPLPHSLWEERRKQVAGEYLSMLKALREC